MFGVMHKLMCYIINYICVCARARACVRHSFLAFVSWVSTLVNKELY
jgi:hypothetical protein